MKRWIVLLSLLVVISLLAGSIAACSSKETTQPTTQAPAQTTQPAAQTTQPPAQTTKPAAPTTQAPAKEKIILKLSVGIPPQDPMVQGLMRWAENFNKVAGNRAEMQIYPGGVLGGAADAFAGTRTRAFEMGHLSVPTLVGYDPIFGVANLPYILDTYEANTEFCLLVKDYMSNIMETKFNQKYLSSWNMGFAEVYTTKKQVKTMADFKGLVIACDKAIDAKSATLLGGSPVTMDFMEEFQSLQKGIVNAGFACAGGALGIMKYYEVIKYLTLSSKSPGQLGVSINLEAYNSLPADLQKLMVDLGNTYQQEMAGEMKKFYEDSYATCKQNGVIFYYLPEAERTLWKTTCQPIIDDYWKQIGPDAAQKMQTWIKQSNDKYPYQAQAQ